MLSPREIAKVRLNYPPGSRIQLIRMNDPYHPVPPNTYGTVEFVDDGGNIHMKWDNGRTLALVPGADKFQKIKLERSPEMKMEL